MNQFKEAFQRPVPMILALMLGLAIGFLVMMTLSGGDDDSAPVTATATPDAPNPVTPQPSKPPEPAVDSSQAEMKKMKKALHQGIADASSEFGGDAAGAVWVGDWPEPVVDGDPNHYRMWSTSKPIASLALLESQEAGGQPIGKASPEMQDALIRSSNCGMRKIVTDLQALNGGQQGAQTQFAGIETTAQIDVSGQSSQFGPPEDAGCDEYLSKLGVKDPQAPVLLFGTTEWTARDGAAFARTLAAGEYGAAGEVVSEQLRQPKEESTDPGGESSVKTDLAWGAGNGIFPDDWDVAYKSGWGGSDDGDYVASQIVALKFGDRSAGVAAAFHPAEQPPDDGIGQVQEDKAIETILSAVAKSLENDLEAPGS